MAQAGKLIFCVSRWKGLSIFDSTRFLEGTCFVFIWHLSSEGKENPNTTEHWSPIIQVPTILKFLMTAK